jgi:serine/threonine protein kinase
MIAGHTPFESGYLSDAINKIKDQNPSFEEPVWQTKENKLKNLIKRMLKKDKNERLSAAECMRDVWFYSLTFAKLSDLTESYQKFIQGVKNAEYGKKIMRVSVCPEK